MLLIFDTNTIVSASLFFNSKPAVALRIAKLKFRILVSDTIVQEIKSVFLREKFDKYLSLENRMEFLSNFLIKTQKIAVTSVITDCRDPKDNKFLELAIDGNADYIITGDPDLLILHSYRGISIVTPSQFLSILTA